MESFKDCLIEANRDQMATLINHITEIISAPWVRAFEKEKEAGLIGTLYCFERSADGQSPAAGLIIFEKNPGTWYVPNIVPIDSGQLSTREYNYILSEFFIHYISIVSNSLNLISNITSGELSDEDILGGEAAKLLEIFSNCANKSSGSAHPKDQQRWFSFIVAACKSGENIDINDLKRLLRKQGWSESMAFDLAMEFEFARDLIHFIEGH